MIATKILHFGIKVPSPSMIKYLVKSILSISVSASPEPSSPSASDAFYSPPFSVLNESSTTSLVIFALSTP